MRVLNYIKKHSRFILFVLVLLVGFFLSNILRYHYDATWEYGMSHAIRMGEVPYRDFNTISTPLFIFLMSIGLFIYDSFWTYLIEVFILELIVFYYVEKAFQKNSLFYIFSICFFAFFALVPSYNLLACLLIVLLLCFEKLEYSDKLIGFFWGLLILSKHTIGIPVVGIVIIGLFMKNYSKKLILTRVLWMLIPLIVFGLYLVINQCIYQFFDLCIFGLFDFASKNNTLSSFTVVACLFFAYTIYILINNKKEISNYYLFASLTFVIPIMDVSHFSFYFTIFILVMFGYQNYKKFPYKSLVIATVFFTALVMIPNILNYKTLIISPCSHFKGMPSLRILVDYNKTLHKHLSKYDNYYVIDGFNMQYDISFDRKITYYDVPLYGNYGYDGTDKLIKRMNEEKDCYFVIKDDSKDYNIGQFLVEAVDYIQDNYQYVESFDGFSVYYKE